MWESAVDNQYQQLKPKTWTSAPGKNPAGDFSQSPDPVNFSRLLTLR
jgi:hypothetical protein